MITLTNLKTYLEITDSSKDALLNTLIKKAVWYAEGLTLQILQTPTDSIEEINTLIDFKSYIKNYHNIQLTKVEKNTGTSFVPVFSDITDNWDYFLNDDWSGILDFKYSLNIQRALKLTYKCWYNADWTETPEDLKGALLSLCSYYYSMAWNWKELKSETVDWDKVEFEITNWSNKNTIPEDIDNILYKYKKYDFSA